VVSAVTRPVNPIHPAAEDVRAVSQTVASREREQSLGEEIANSVSHGVGLVAAVIAVPFLVVGAGQSGYTAEIVGVSVFASTMVLLYLMSTLYHALPRNRA
jgi:hemolysin III